MNWKTIFAGRKPKKDLAHTLYVQLVKQARLPDFYAELGAPDTLEGRFELVTLHAFLLLHRLKSAGPDAKETAQQVFDVLFDDMDQTLRELGVGDLSVGKKIKSMAELFYGRMKAYDAGMDAEDDTLANAIRRIVFAEAQPAVPQVKAFEQYMRAAVADLRQQSTDDILTGRIHFPSVPVAVEKGVA
jgi:cytochrome b pre-mRNA-processing protein 3